MSSVYIITFAKTRLKHAKLLFKAWEQKISINNLSKLYLLIKREYKICYNFGMSKLTFLFSLFILSLVFCDYSVFVIYSIFVPSCIICFFFVLISTRHFGQLPNTFKYKLIIYYTLQRIMKYSIIKWILLYLSASFLRVWFFVIYDTHCTLVPYKL